MKAMWRIAALAALLIPIGSLAAETKFSGELKPEMVFNIPGSRGYDESPLNPGNQWGYNDLMFRNQIDLKLDSTSESAALDLWFQVKQYPIADLLVGSAAIAESLEATGAGGTDSLSGYSAATGGLFTVVDPYIYSLDILRASVAWMPSETLKFTMGRQSFLTGYGYGWNPMDLANPPKNPTDPGAYVRGVDAVTVQLNPTDWMNAKVYGAMPPEGFAWAYEEILAGGELTFNIPALEFKVAGLWGGTESNADSYDAYPHAGALAVYADVLGIGVYGEAAVRSRSRRNTSDGSDGTDLASGPVWSALAGAEYYLPSGMQLVVEYFYNGEGWNRADRSRYAAALQSGVTGEEMALYSPTYFSRHYLLTNVMIPWYALETTFNVNTVWSLDSKAVILTPNAVVNLNYEGTLVSEIWYSGQFSLDDSERNEAWLSPVRHSAWMNVRYYF